MGNVVNAVDEGDEGDEGDEDNEGDDVAYVRFHTTTIANLVILYFATLGLYSLFWFYRHWSVVWENRDRRISPLARTLFPIFFVHQLFKRIDDGARAAGLRPGWKPDSHATTYVVLLLGSQVVGWIFGDVGGFVVQLALFAAGAAPLAAAQKVANAADGKPELDEGEGGQDEDEDEDEEPRKA